MKAEICTESETIKCNARGKSSRRNKLGMKSEALNVIAHPPLIDDEGLVAPSGWTSVKLSAGGGVPLIF